MTTSGRGAARRLAAALAQVAVGWAAHAVAAGCLPSTAALVVSLPLAVLGVLAVGCCASGHCSPLPPAS